MASVQVGVELVEMSKEDIAGPSSLAQEEPLLLKKDEANGLDTRITVITNPNSEKHDNNIQKSFFEKHSPAAVDVQWENISYSVSRGWFKEKKLIIKGHFGKVRSGEMTAILGPSGSGKTTLLKILAGYKFRNISGSVALNGQSQTKKMHRLLSRYIMQEEDVLPYLTVREIIEVAAKLKIRSSSTTDHREIVSEVINVLGLTECQNTRTKNISGGERKRLSIAQELVSNPPVLFIDEPTSGLDSTSCIQLVKLLKQLSDEGHTIVCTIHQPSASVLSLFDQLYMMSKGECVYQDSVSALLPFLESQGLQCPPYHNPADYILEVVSGLYGDYNERFIGIVRSKVRSNGNAHFTEEVQSFNYRGSLLDDLQLGRFRFRNFAVNPLIQFTVILLRTYKSILRNPFLTHLRLLTHVVVGLIIGLLYWKIGDDASMVLKNTSFIFFCLLFLMFTSMMPTVLTFPCEMSIFLREQVNNWYSAVIYYIAKTVADIPFQIVFSIIYSSIVYWMTGQPPDLNRFGMFLLLTTLVSLVAQSVGLVVGAATSLEVAVFLAPIISGPIILFSDYFLKLSTVPSYLQWIAYLSYFRFAFEATMQVIYGFDRDSLHCPDFEHCFLPEPELYLQFVGVRNTNVWYNVLALVGFLFFVRAIGYGVLKWKIYFRK